MVFIAPILCLLVAVAPQTEVQALKGRLSHPAPRVSRFEEISYSTLPTGISSQEFVISRSTYNGDQRNNGQLRDMHRFKRGIGGYNNGNKPSIATSPTTSGIWQWPRPIRASNGNKLAVTPKPKGRLNIEAESQPNSHSQIAFASSSQEISSSPTTDGNPLKFAVLAMAAITGALRSIKKESDENQNFQLPSKKSLFELDSGLSVPSSSPMFTPNLGSTLSNPYKGNIGLIDTNPKPTKFQINTWENDNCYFCKTAQTEATPTTVKRTGTAGVHSNDGTHNMFPPKSPLGFGMQHSSVQPLMLNGNNNWPATSINSWTNVGSFSGTSEPLPLNHRVPIQPSNSNNWFPSSYMDHPDLLQVKKTPLKL